MLYIQPKLIPVLQCSIYSSAVDGAGDTDLYWNPSDLGTVGWQRLESVSPSAGGTGSRGLSSLEYILRGFLLA